MFCLFAFFLSSHNDTRTHTFDILATSHAKILNAILDSSIRRKCENFQAPRRHVGTSWTFTSRYCLQLSRAQLDHRLIRMQFTREIRDSILESIIWSRIYSWKFSNEYEIQKISKNITLFVPLQIVRSTLRHFFESNWYEEHAFAPLSLSLSLFFSGNII